MEAYRAQFYDAYFTGVEGEVDFYVDEAADVGGPVLELGCGTGRVLLPIARSGVEVVGLDRSPQLLAVLREKLGGEEETTAGRVRLVEADMVDFSLEQTVAAAFIPYRSFQHLLDRQDQERALHAIGQHLEEGGRLVFNTYDPLGDIAREGLASPMRKDLDFFDERTGRAVVVYYSRQVDPQVQIIEQELLFEEFDEEGVSLGRWLSVLQLRWTPQGEMAHLLERCGFHVDALYGDFEGAPYPGYGEQVWVASRA